MRHIRWSFGVVLLVCLSVFLMQNIEIVHVRFLFFDFSMPRALLIVTVFVIGALAGWITSDILRSRSKTRLGQ